MKKMKRYNGEEGSKVEIDPLEAANASEASKSIADEAEGERVLERMRDEAAKPKPKPKAMAKPAPKAAAAPAPAPKASPVDETKLSLSNRFKLSRDRSRSGSGPTDTRSVSQRLRSAFGMKNGGSASSRADGIASKGKTRGKMC
jgi:hypothetical protein